MYQAKLELRVFRCALWTVRKKVAGVRLRTKRMWGLKPAQPWTRWLSFYIFPLRKYTCFVERRLLCEIALPNTCSVAWVAPPAPPCPAAVQGPLLPFTGVLWWVRIQRPFMGHLLSLGPHRSSGILPLGSGKSKLGV